jgi:signal transduction histidine kinase
VLAKSALPAALAQGTWHGEASLHTRDRREIPVAATMTAHRGGGGELEFFSLLARDITDLRRAQRLETIGALAAGVAHDLNNALAAVMMGISIVREELDTDPGSTLEIIETSARRGGEMVRQLLSFAKGVEGKRMLLDPVHLLRETVSIMRATSAPGLRVQGRYPGCLGTVLGDPTQIHQLLLNLCLNARDAMPSGGSLVLRGERVFLTERLRQAHPKAQPGEHVCLSVEDTGAGIPPEILPRIFEPFFTTKGAEKGTGLGLASVRSIARTHQGFVEVETEVGVGSKFSVFLPLAESPPTGKELAN